MVNRAANATIKGYFYQFDFAILQLLKAVDEDAKITVEGVEDVDIEDVSNENYIQCKYYAATDYNHSVIKPAIAAMIVHFKEVGSKTTPLPKYKLYGHYNSGQEKLPERHLITVDFIKTHFLTTTKKEGPAELVHVKNSISDAEILQFAGQLEIDVFAQSYESQFESIAKLLTSAIPGATKEDAENLFYPASINNIRALAIEQSQSARVTTKKRFLKEINNKNFLFSRWLKQYQGSKKYAALVRDKYFKQSAATSIENKARFFIVNLPRNSLDVGEALDFTLKLSKKFSNRASSRIKDNDRFCPYLHLANTDESGHRELKKSLRDSAVLFLDGHDFKGSEFYVDSILKGPTSYTETRLKLIDELTDVNSTLRGAHRRPIEVFEFYHEIPIAGLNLPQAALYAAIKVDSFEDIKEMIK
ncbi:MULTISPECIES: DUF4297 family anti-phage-associated protein [Pseudomonas chlororaphis group]|uniref:DUF4297 family anti-phage-associated protein n=1 Tax=Pseudomonas chlororaphis group TaxID=136842 RepID=UPI000F627C13|nr:MULTISPECIES: DUF4297 family anti-phage-associated protein [Pseudomonas chlororaphis group]MCO7579882.1 hypothetical protein [Pseudomonas protegens]MCO7585821.1 hypothetical protein [Pseudomonas chlororaphis]MCO7602892.1 hypothetical protein [Pseudomonas chlororaphis]